MRWATTLIILNLLFGEMAVAAEKSHVDMRESGVISIWIGSLSSEEFIEGYLASDFSGNFGFIINPKDGPEYNFSEKGPVEIELLLSDVSWGRHFAKSVANEIAKKGHSRASAVLVFYNFRYDQALIKKATSEKMKFVGVFPFKAK